LHSYRFDEISNRDETVIPIEVRDRDLTVDVVSEISHAVSGRIRFDGSRLPPEGVTQLWLAARPIGQSNGIPIPGVRIRRDGTFGFPSLPAGKFRLSFENVPEPFYIKSVQQGNLDVLKDGLTIPGKTVSSLVVAVGDDGGQITGAVRARGGDEDPVEVVLIPERPGILRSDLYKVADVDENGQFHLGGVAPGRYQIYAWRQENVTRRDYFHPEFMHHFRERGIPVQMGSRGDIKVVLQVLQ